jgi:hypothetical protein
MGVTDLFELKNVSEREGNEEEDCGQKVLMMISKSDVDLKVKIVER